MENEQEHSMRKGKGKELEVDGCQETCAICLESIVHEDIAIIRECGHPYCVTCILKWATCGPQIPLCPQCKGPFESLYVYRDINGRLHDKKVEESLYTLLNATWFPSEEQDADCLDEVAPRQTEVQQIGEASNSVRGFDEIAELEDHYLFEEYSTGKGFSRKKSRMKLKSATKNIVKKLHNT